ncbi:hypothetical protein Taro_043334 [Colocasia esculenta]|uniref:3'-5' exonuclease domain-containing protein n=1 Tax=Colocasia esculenta TaxID=4460 RepID=A0A843WR48_COLES|nr:hypothetical protein [Colocasia esculenta]
MVLLFSRIICYKSWGLSCCYHPWFPLPPPSPASINESDNIMTTYTTAGAEVEAWLRDILRIHRRRLRFLVVGLDAEWLPERRRGEHNPVALLQLCVGRRCLLFHIIHADYVPRELARFLGDSRFNFVGVRVDYDARKLAEDYELQVRNAVELGGLAAGELQREELRRAGLSGLARVVMGVDQLEKSKRVTLSRWDAPWLSLQQVKYACVDAFVSFEVGRRLLAGDF